ncbi:hypothetical protein CDQ84_16885 [Clostridium thermosuccinogenes]|uniref:ABC transporter substrate-binding protein n=1 Tax=Clostridium thermosuccinogenes TaxID=84032 RepID=A0A2K2F9W4_9CLOT|nr:extracellular solute-binding protein [Pseudoclostridium thermosuccinogenes]AUS98577.1 hypothetical protein CDO33_20245 [Pseudoclostridium thermosuccinogenes]PNT94913.1 hypothetical protein CDQ85_16650 [Pseudoclostridium thermosuccinogenes]PNT95538.1 hypothetical protein CDQ84_16885 [Pseudoclostridium thermosuccinogenes]
MINMNVKKILSVLLIVTFVITFFAGCGSGNNKASQQSNDNSSASKSNEKSNGEDKTAAEEVYTFKMFANFTPAEQSEADKAFFELVERENNVKIDLEIPPSTNYAERLQIMIAGGDYPEVVLITNSSDKVVLDAVKSGVFLPLNEYLENAPNLKQYTYDISWESLKLTGDENIYGIPRTSIARADGYIVRKDWLDKVGITIPEDGAVTKEEFVQIVRAFTKEDPDGNGKDDTYGLAASTDSGDMGPLLAWPFGIIGWQKADNGPYEYMNLQYSREHDNYKKALEFTQTLWKEGLIDPDWPVTKRDVSMERFKQGITGVISEFAGWIPQYLDDMLPINPNVELTYITGVKNDDGIVEGGSFSTGFWGFWAITTSAKKPERIIQVFDWLLSDDGWNAANYGPEGVTYTVEGDKKVATDLYQDFKWGRAIVRRNNDPGFFVPLNTPSDLQPKLEKWIGICIDQFVFSLDRGYRPAAADNPEFIDYSQKTYAQTISKIIVGELPVSAYDELLEGWYENGGEEYVQQMNEYIKSMEE